MRSSRPAHFSGLDWRAASKCTGGNCVEVATMGEMIAVRDSKNPEGAVLVYTATEWNEFAANVRKGQYDHLV
ncbi:hypothetical protein Psi02_24030 [Planotetraspora silvatica]|uniref:DUF397 domain-containing protein n=1 Tax=Planotetraspora silvatica TaxID=234614 RepID=A0A8J3XLV8_9ACTN|nr:DUF397 domain-containing protein [Planotetraspora silvatica]GII45979.1 hypothetical protein Psi02_24030 [Planotetraspora silvatica]